MFLVRPFLPIALNALCSSSCEFSSPCNILVALQSPIFGYLWGTSIPWFRVPWGYPFRGGIWAPYQYHGTMEWKTHTIPHSYQYHVTIPYQYHVTIPYQMVWCHFIPSYQSWHRVSGVLFQNIKIISAGCNTGPLGAIFCGVVLQVFPEILGYKLRPDSPNHLLKMSLNRLYPSFPMHPKPFNDTYLSQSFLLKQYSSKSNKTTSIVMKWS